MTLLCIDDEEVALQIRKMVLEQEGYEVLTATSGEQGLALLAEREVSAVILDYNMPGMNGAELAGILRKTYPNLPLIMLSGCAYLIPRTTFEMFDAFVTKGDNAEKLLSAIKDSLQNQLPERPTILHVDDNEQHRYALSRVLRSAGFDIIEAATGKEALDKAENRPHVILLDINLPDISGFEVCRRLRANQSTRAIPVIQISATYQSEFAETEALQAGANQFLPQPLDLKVVVGVIQALLSKRRT